MSELKINKDKFGKHLILDCTVKEFFTYPISSESSIANYLDTVTRICGMQPVIPTIAMKFPFNNELCGLVQKLNDEGVESETLKEYTTYVDSKLKDDTGVSGFSIWNTSHASAHSWLEENYISIDLYSCLDFDEKPVIEFTKTFFHVVEMRIVEVKRSVTEPQQIRQWSE